LPPPLVRGGGEGEGEVGSWAGEIIVGKTAGSKRWEGARAEYCAESLALFPL